jgi:hypothetical protein
MLLLKLVLLFLLSKLSFSFFLSTGFLFKKFVSMFKPSLFSFFRATQTAVHSMLIYYKIVLAYKTKKKNLRDLYS